MRRISSVFASSLILIASIAAALAAAPPPSERQLAALLSPHPNIEAIRALGPGVLPALAGLYERSDETRRTTIAWTLYSLGWKSEEAKRALMHDVRSSNASLRLQVQVALGRVSNDPEVVNELLDNAQDEDNPQFRDKAACALANDQIHLTDVQKLRLYERLVDALGDPNLQVRQIALEALRMLTGQTRSFDAAASQEAREPALREWQRWLEAYRSRL
jgi:HEAT repeat protein